MLRSLVSSAVRTAATAGNGLALRSQIVHYQRACISHFINSTTLQKPLLCAVQLNGQTTNINSNLLQTNQQAVTLHQPVRTLTKFSLIKGKRKSVKAVVKRFKRLDWGMWIRTYTGRQKKLWKKTGARRRRLRQHVFTNSTQSWLLDKMVTSFWRRPKYYVDDPYEPYHKRDEYYATKGKTFKV